MLLQEIRSMSRPLIYMYVLLSVLMMITSADAVETAPRISDREIVESLSELKQEQKHLAQQIQQTNENLKQQIQQTNENLKQQIQQINAQIQQTKVDLEQQIQQSHDTLNQRIDDMMIHFNNMANNFNQRFDSIINLVIALFSAVMVLIVGLVGYMIWDRRTAQKPLREKMKRMEEKTLGIDEHLAMGHPSGSIIQRMLAAFRELAKTDEKVADILRTFSLL